ncbi:hypothetical protein V5J96_001428 [Enterobacter cloacae]|nr:hypothetical protein [Enterobacter cloacae]PJD27143.1 hypothetical protein B9Q28_22855 [Enterobacter cloacae]HCL6949642.1 hypothetical protein [Enterobacter cloacae]HDC4411833.1 hypothetical protein [Enterobacter cloacae]HEB0911728.1 hypothetical protein [Enterobacter cloacae]
MISISYLNLNTCQPNSTCVAYRVYIVILTYIKPLQEIEAEILTHVERLNMEGKGTFLASGRRFPRTGGVILAKCESLASLEERLREDPFHRLKPATVEFIPFVPSMKTELLEDVLAPQ